MFSVELELVKLSNQPRQFGYIESLECPDSVFIRSYF
jgi:hypothetical protein